MRRFWFLLPLLLAGCTFPNDLDYPVVPGDILSFEVEGQKGVTISTADRTVVIDLEETADPSHLTVRSVRLSEGATADIPAWLDLREPVTLTLKTYQTYEWTLTARQDIERYVRCEGQVEEARFNPETRHVYVYVADTQPLSRLVIEAMKLEPEGSSIVSTTGWTSGFDGVVETTEAVHFPMTLDCVLERTFDVQYAGAVRTWHFKALQVEINTVVTSVDARCRTAKVRGIFSGEAPVVEYRRVGDTAWQAAEGAVVAGVGISVTLAGLDGDTDYEVRVACGDVVSPVRAFHTEAPVQLDNMSFDNWSSEGKVWFPYLPDGSRVWDSANKATASFTGSATTPDEDFVAVAGPGKKSARLQSSFAVVKFAAGNLFTGSFVRLQGLGAELAWGIPFTVRPEALRGYIAYEPAPVTDADADHAALKGQNDTGHVIVILTDWDAPFHVKSAEKVFVDFDGDPAIIAYGRYALSEKTDGWQAFELPLEYRSDRIPKYVVVVASSSALGDYFTGGRGSTLWLDELEFVY